MPIKGEYRDRGRRDQTSHMPELTPRDHAILDFENAWTRSNGVKEGRIIETFGISAARYYQLVNALLDNPAAFEVEPALVNRLRRLRESRKADRLHNRLHRG